MHEHTWIPLSSHVVSDGWLTYLLCSCGSRAMELAPHAPSQVVIATRGRP